MLYMLLLVADFFSHTEELEMQDACPDIRL